MKKILSFILLLSFSLTLSCSNDKTSASKNVKPEIKPQVFNTRGGIVIVDNNEHIILVEKTNMLGRYEIESKKEIIRTPKLIDSKNWPGSSGAHLGISQDENTVYSLKKRGNEIQIWNAADLTLKSSFKIDVPINKWVEKFAVSPDNQNIILAYYGSSDVYVFDIQSKILKHKISTSESLVKIYFSPDGKQLITKHYDHASIWDINNGVKLHDFNLEPIKIPGYSIKPHHQSLNIKYLDNQKHIAHSTNKKIEILDKNTFEVINTIILLPMDSLDFIADISLDPLLENAILIKGKYFESKQQLQILNLNSNEILLDSFEPKKLPENSSNVLKIIYEGTQEIGMSPNGKYAFALFETTPSAAVWESSTGKLVFLGKKNINNISFSKDSTKMILQRNLEAVVYDLNNLPDIKN